ncbi:hypothetical protein P9112_002187 [Eukaryota sp. TZLM1-RC]
MPLLAISLVRQNVESPPVILSSESDLTSFGRMFRGGAADTIKFSAREVVKRMKPATRYTVHEDRWVVYAYLRSDNLGAVVVADQAYPSRAAFAVTYKVLEVFSTAVPKSTWMSSSSDFSVPFPPLKGLLSRFQDPAKADQCTAIMSTIEDTKHVLLDSIDKLLQRGEQLDKLVEDSADLSMSTRMFYKRAKKHDRCCVMM